MNWTIHPPVRVEVPLERFSKLAPRVGELVSMSAREARPFVDDYSIRG